MNWLKSLFADANGIPDDARLAAFLLVLSYIANSIVAIVMSHEHLFNAQEFGIGAGALSAGIGVWFGQRKDH